jgi:SAM-dependent methyltransferase
MRAVHHSMNHFPDRQAVFREWCRVLRPGRRAVFRSGRDHRPGDER